MTNTFYKRNLLALLTLLCLLLTACSTPEGTSSGQDGALDWYAVRIFSDHSGWALTSRGIMRTGDNGNNWAIVTPPELESKGGFAGLTSYFLNSQSAWVVRTGDTKYIQYGDKQKPEMARVFHTTDGGKTWRNSEIPDTANTYSDIRSGAGFVAGAFAPLAPYGENRRIVSINNILANDGQNVWVAVSCMSVHTGGGQKDYTNVYRRLWHSTDGGQSWHKAWENTDRAFPNGAASWIDFANTKVGLMSGPKQLDLLITRDGQTWQGKTLPAQDLTSQDLQMSSQEPPTLFNTHDGAVSLRRYEPGVRVGQGASYEVLLYVTHDGGLTWQKAGQIKVPQYTAIIERYDQTVNYLDSLHWLVAGNGVLYRTNDAGMRWQTLPMSSAYQYAGSLSFVSDQEGWGIGKSLSAATATPSHQTLSTSLIHTTDGGSTWEAVKYQIG